MSYERTLVRIRERSFLDVLELALLVVRRRPLPLLVSTVAGVLPFAALNYWLARAGHESAVFWGSIFLPWLEAPLATAALTVMLGGLMFGERPRTWRIVRTVTVSAIPMAFYQVAVRGLLMIIPLLYLVVPARLLFVNEVLLLERGGWLKAGRRSGTLCSGSGVELILHWLGQVFFGIWFVLAFWFGTGAVNSVLFSSDLTWDRPGWSDLAGFRFQLGLWIALAFFTVARFLTYIDQRIRLEGWEIDLRLRSVGKAMEEARAW